MTQMNNKDIFKALSCQTRINILKILIKNEMHISGLARELKISVPVTSKHIKILENAGMINKRVYGNIHLLTTKVKKFENILETFIEQSTIKVDKNKSIFEALKQIPSIEIKKVENNYYIKSIDGEEGYYIYEVDGKLPKKPINEYNINKKIKIDLKKLVSIRKKEINININNKD
ncbi:hypothetical protein AYK24_05415 [Thermoplasmatales archaeon SG8-52-4]|nr:MAG: hypothetical protein AYK24_05415 [Thermoplasmatales archaeon SG8-52-4]